MLTLVNLCLYGCIYIFMYNIMHMYMYLYSPHAHAWKLHIGCGMKIALGDILHLTYYAHKYTWSGQLDTDSYRHGG